jgi:tetratricopeptide (TPR) repeat protein
VERLRDHRQPLRDVKTAIAYEEKIVARRPDDLYSYLSLGRLYAEIGDEESASASLHKCAELAERPTITRS